MTAKADVMALYPPKSGSADIASNPGQALDRDWIASVRVNRSAVERRCASLGGRRTVKKGLAGSMAVAGNDLYRSHHA